MRGEEAAALKRGCLRLMRDEHGKVKGYELVGRIFKPVKTSTALNIAGP
jgi:hypothetical protein